MEHSYQKQFDSISFNAKGGFELDKLSLKTVWLGVMLGILVATSPQWLNASAMSASRYEAPWMPVHSSY